MNGGSTALNLLRLTVVVYIALSLILTWIAVDVGVPYRVGGVGNPDTVADDALIRGTGISAPLALLIAFGVLLLLTWLPRPWRAIPVLLFVVPATVWLYLTATTLTMEQGPFGTDVGAFGIALWALSLAALVLIIVFGLIAGFRSLRRATAAEG